MSENTERDTHFTGFAKLLYEDFLQLQREDESSLKEMLGYDYPEKWRTKVEQRITQRAYDLLKYAFDYCDVWEESRAFDHSYDWDALLGEVPDMTEWPADE